MLQRVRNWPGASVVSPDLQSPVHKHLRLRRGLPWARGPRSLQSKGNIRNLRSACHAPLCIAFLSLTDVCVQNNIEDHMGQKSTLNECRN